MNLQVRDLYLSNCGHFYITRDEYLQEEGYYNGLSGEEVEDYYRDEPSYQIGYKMGRQDRIDRLYS